MVNHPEKKSTTSWRSVSNWPRWLCRIMFSGLIYPLWGPAALNRNKRRNGKSL